MSATDTSKLRTIAGVIGVGSLALFGATACEDNDAGTEEPAENGEVEEGGAEDQLPEGDDTGGMPDEGTPEDGMTEEDVPAEEDEEM